MDISFIVMYFAAKNISFLSVFLCWSPGDLVKLSAEAGKLGLRVAVRAPAAASPTVLPAYDARREGVLLDMSCPDATHVLRVASTTRAFLHRYSWLLLHDSPYNRSAVQDALAEAVILPDADVTWAARDALFDVYRVKAQQPLIITNLGVGRNCSFQCLEQLWARLPSAVTRRKNLHGVSLTASTVITQPQFFKSWTDYTMRHLDIFPKVSYPLMMLFAEDVNFRFNLRQVALYGEEYNGSFTGLAGLLQRQEVEFGIASIFMRADRWRVLHYCSETVQLRGAFIFRQPAQSAVSNVFLLPFSRGVWLAAAGVSAAAAALLAALASLARVAPDPALRRITAAEAFTFAVGTICQQGFHIVPVLTSARLLMFSTLLAGLFAFTAYAAKIVAILQMPSDAIQTLADLARSPIALAVQETTYKRVYFAESNNPLTQEMYRRKLLPLGDRAYLQVEEGIERVRTGLFAYQVELSAGYEIISRTFTEREKCGLQEIQAFRPPMVAVPIRKHSGYRDLLASRLRWQRETGLMSHARRLWLAARPRCDASGAGFLSVGLIDVLPAFQTLAGGAALAVALLLCELAATCWNSWVTYPCKSQKLPVICQVKESKILR